MLLSVVRFFDLILLVLRPLVFTAGVVAAVGAVASWAVRTRRIPPFSPTAQLIRKRVEPWLVNPVERRILRAGGSPYAAPWWALAAVIVGGLVLVSAVQFLRDQLVMLLYASTQSGSLIAILFKWTFAILRIALIVRVIASWVGGSPYSKWWGWSYRLTEWMLAPLRSIIPTIGMIDITVLVAYFGLGLLESLVVGALIR